MTEDVSSLYLDFNATTPLEGEVLSSIQTALAEAWGNPSSSHEAGLKAKAYIDTARKNVADMIAASPTDIIFTSGGTEADNMIINTCVDYFNEERQQDPCQTDYCVGDDRGVPHIISSHIEHPAVNEMLQYLQTSGRADVTYVPVSHVTGRVEVDAVLAAVRPNTILVTVMLANNETGIIQPVQSICLAVKSLKRQPRETTQIFVHTDAAQAIGKISVSVQDLGVDYLTIVGHKFYGPRIGAVYARDLTTGGVPLYPMLFGGGQEKAYRPGTENTGMIAGLGKACEMVSLHVDRYSRQMRECRDYLEEALQSTFPGRIHVNGKYKGTERLPNTCNVSILGQGLEGHKVLSQCHILQASVGAACHEQNKPSSILLAVGIPEHIARNALRLSIGRHNTRDDMDVVVEDLRQAVSQLEGLTNGETNIA